MSDVPTPDPVDPVDPDEPEVVADPGPDDPA